MIESEREQRQLDKMSQVIDGFLAKQVNLQEIVGSLAFLIEHLDFVSQDWKDEFQNLWLELEIINAEIGIDKPSPTEDEQKHCEKIVQQLKNVVESVRK